MMKSMLIYRIVVSINGKYFSPSNFLKEIETDFLIFDKNEPDELIWEDRNDRYEFGSISVLIKKQFCLKNEFDQIEKCYNSFFHDHKIKIASLGATQVIYNLDIFYSDSCLFELSCSENYENLKAFDFSIPINVFKLSENEITDILLENGYSNDFIKNYEW